MNVCPCGHERYGYKLKDGILSKNVERSKHMLRRPPAWAIQSEVWRWHVEEVCVIAINDLERDRLYWATRETFEKNSRILERKHGEQRYMRLSLWETMSHPIMDKLKVEIVQLRMIL